MRRLLVVCVLFSLPVVAAERVAVLGGPGAGASAADLERLLGACEATARELTGLTVLRAPASTERCGAREDCLLVLAGASGVEHLLVVEPLPSRRKGGLEADVAWVDAVRGRVVRRLLTVAPGGVLARELRPVVAALVPAFARKGWGGLVAPDAVRLRVDGRMTEPGDVVALAAGPHEVDLLPRSGSALLTREQVLEGVRRTLTLEAGTGPLVAETGRERGGAGLRVASAVTFSLGALAVAGSLVAGGFSRSALGGLRPCADDPRDCSTFAEASLARERAGRHAHTGNVLLGVGGGLLGVGGALFAFDLLATPSR